MKATALWGLGMFSLLAVSIVASSLTVGTAATDAPEAAVRPITCEDVSETDCLLVDASRLDCPGKIECPITGELVCRDQCPLAAATREDPTLSPCCRDD